jgi:biopolymer transport protein ExbD
MDPVTAVDVGSKEPWREGPPRRSRLFVALLVFVAAAVVAGAALAVRRFAEPRAADDAPYDDEKKLRDRALHPPVAIVAPKDINLPEVSGGVTIPPQDLVLTISKTMLAVEGEDIVPVPADPRKGFDAKYKRSGPADLHVRPLAMVMDWALRYPPMVGRPAAMTLLVDRDVPYRLLVEVMFTLGQSEWAVFHLGALHQGKVVGLKDPKVPRASAGRPQAARGGLGLTVLVVADGFSMKARGGNVAPGCQDVGPGLAIPKTAAGYDYVALRACAAKLKSAAPEFASEKEVVISASPDIAYGALVTTVDTLQADELFPEVMFGLAR